MKMKYFPVVRQLPGTGDISRSLLGGDLMCSRNWLTVVVGVLAASCGTDATRNETPNGISTGARATYAAGSCAHDPCATGTKLTSSCNSCVQKICSSDSFCCNNKWDQQCVNEVASICGL